MKKKILVISLIVLVFGIILVIYSSKFKKEEDNKEENSKYSSKLQKLINKKVKYDKLLEISFSESGDMNGNIYLIEINVENLELTKKYSSGMGEDIEITTYKISEEDIKRLENMIKEYNFVAWTDLPFDEDNIVLDAATPVLTFRYDNSEVGGSKYESYSINYYTKIPKDGYNLLNEFTDAISKLMTEDNLINTKNEKNR